MVFFCILELSHQHINLSLVFVLSYGIISIQIQFSKEAHNIAHSCGACDWTGLHFFCQTCFITDLRVI